MQNLKYLSDEEAKRDIIEVGKRLYAKGFVAANDGNISARVSDMHIWATPTNISKGFMTEDMLVKLDVDGNIIEGTYRPSSEIKMHLAIYRESPETLSVVHAHPPVSTAFAAAGIALDIAILQEAVVSLGVIPLAPYAPPGSSALAETAAPYAKDYHGILLEHHGAVAWGDNVMQAFYRLECIEYNATVLMHAKTMGIERPLTEKQIDELISLRPAWGFRRGGRPKGRPD